jgi:hypothetical protein
MILEQTFLASAKHFSSDPTQKLSEKKQRGDPAKIYICRRADFTSSRPILV